MDYDLEAEEEYYKPMVEEYWNGLRRYGLDILNKSLKDIDVDVLLKEIKLKNEGVDEFIILIAAKALHILSKDEVEWLVGMMYDAINNIGFDNLTMISLENWCDEEMQK